KEEDWPAFKTADELVQMGSYEYGNWSRDEINDQTTQVPMVDPVVIFLQEEFNSVAEKSARSIIPLALVNDKISERTVFPL
mgnify:CR=1